ncbi:uncharacterized protein LOC130982397 [Arachis stenosperma]|uniref:uncharacterized protein LOC130982397 n=1 Tax=Arachis stenosperma TaxID=217475 RepID=UPI0025ABEF93|nr:uncharacterized protein LOC130982397 [Arachis stenosperma]XP_057762371.1 uncharacterized protein LOC130982397 [Arachis stenosperma]
MPVYDLPSKILCRVINVQLNVVFPDPYYAKLKAEPDMDEVLAQITLLPEQNQDETVEKEPPLPPRCHRPLHLDKWSLSKLSAVSRIRLKPGASKFSDSIETKYVEVNSNCGYRKNESRHYPIDSMGVRGICEDEIYAY